MAFAQLSRTAQAYVGSVIVAGAMAIAQSAHSLFTEPVDYRWLLLAGLTLVSGSANVKLPSVAATISVSETFVFASVLLFGAGPGTVIVALDAFVVSVWVAFQHREFYRLLFNIAAPAISIWIAAQTFFILLGRPPLVEPGVEVGLVRIALPLLAFTLIYFLFNSWLIAIAISLKENVAAFAVWRDNLLWLSLNYFGGASVAALLVGYRSTLDVGLLLVIAPILLVLYFTFKTAMGRVEDANRHLAEVNRLHLSTIETLAMAIDAKDQVTHGHIRRVQTFAVELAKHLGVDSAEQIAAIQAAALLHDMGKLAVPEHILNKPGPLNRSEVARMRTHASIGADILSSIKFPYPVVPIVRHHHESWDGTGYPDGLKGTEIPIGARILAVVDCFDALTSDRPYRPKLSADDAMEILRSRRASTYDPLVVDTFVHVFEKLRLTDEQHAVLAYEGMAKVDILTAEVSRQLPRRLLDASQLALSSLLRTTGAKVGILFMTDEDATRLSPIAIAGSQDQAFRTLTIGVGERLSGWVAANGRPIVNSDPALDLGSDFARREHLSNALSVPAAGIERGAVAIITIYRGGNAPFSQEDVYRAMHAAKELEPLFVQMADS